jgi:hypothetical protein
MGDDYGRRVSFICSAAHRAHEEKEKEMITMMVMMMI